VSRIYYAGVIPTLKIKTRLRFDLEGGRDNHRIIGLNDNGDISWIYLKDLKLGDYIGIKYGYNLYGSNNKIGPLDLDEDLAYFIGVIVGDGYIKRSGFSITCSKKDESIVKEIDRILKDKWSLNLNFRDHPRNPENWRCGKNDKKLKEFFSFIPEIVTKSYFKRIPKPILEAPQNIQTAFLSGLFDTDGSVNKNRLKVVITQNNFEIIQEIRMLLLNMGIISRYDLRKTSWQRGKGTTHRLNIDSIQAKKFYNLIGFRLKRKNDLLKHHIDRAESMKSRQYNTNYDYIPLQREKFKKIIKESENLKYKPMSVYLKTKNPSKLTVRNFLDSHSDVKHLEEWQYLDNLMKESIVWLPVEEIIESESECWDLNVEDKHNFIANGFINHNSAILNAICWALVGKTSKRGKIAVNDIIGPWGDETIVNLHLSGQFELRIQRTKMDKGSDLRFSINDIDKHVPGNVEKTQHNLLYYLGVPKEHYKKWFEDFMNTYYFSKEIAQVFTGVTSTKSDKFQFISRFMNLRLLDLSRENTKNKLDVAESDYKIMNSNLSIIKDRLKGMASKDVLTMEIESFNKKIDEEKDNLAVWDQQIEMIQFQENLINDIKNKKQMIEIKESDLKEKLGILKNQYDIKIADYDGLEELSKKATSTEEQINKIDTQELYKHQDNMIKGLLTRSEQLTNIKAKIAVGLETIKNYKEKLTNVDKCPKCKTPLMYLEGKIVELNPKELQSTMDAFEKQLTQNNRTHDQLKEEDEQAEQHSKEIAKSIEHYESLKRILDGYKIRLENKDKLTREIHDIMGQKETFESVTKELIDKLRVELKEKEEHYRLLPKQTATVAEVKKAIETAGFHVEELNKSKQRNEFILEKIDEDLQEKEGLEEAIKDATDHIDRLHFIFNGFPDIRKARIDEFIPQFKVEANNFMNQLRSKIKIVIDTDRETKKGTLVDEFPIEGIDIHGKKRGLETFSEGEKSRISISLAWALRALTRKKVYLPFQFNMLDEIADGLDESGIDFLNKIMGDDDQYLVITHFSHFKNKFSSSIKAIRENGQSFVETIQ
jgi:intein/homing endonuclease